MYQSYLWGCHKSISMGHMCKWPQLSVDYLASEYPAVAPIITGLNKIYTWAIHSIRPLIESWRPAMKKLKILNITKIAILRTFMKISERRMRSRDSSVVFLISTRIKLQLRCQRSDLLVRWQGLYFVYIMMWALFTPFLTISYHPRDLL